MNNLERELDCKVMDRTLLILDIFAGRAITSEGKIQDRTGAASLPVGASGRTARISFQTWRWYRNKRTGVRKNWKQTDV